MVQVIIVACSVLRASLRLAGEFVSQRVDIIKEDYVSYLACTSPPK